MAISTDSVQSNFEYLSDQALQLEDKVRIYSAWESGIATILSQPYSHYELIDLHISSDLDISDHSITQKDLMHIINYKNRPQIAFILCEHNCYLPVISSNIDFKSHSQCLYCS